jgi:predicted transcriptional regulator
MYASFEDLRAAMEADAVVVNRRMREEGACDSLNVEVSTDVVLDYIEGNPGLDVAALAKHFKKSVSSFRTRMKNMEKRGLVKVQFAKVQGNPGFKRLYFVPRARA